MISSTRSGSIPTESESHIRILPALWTTACVFATVGLSLTLYVGQLQQNAQLTTTLNAQVSTLLGGVQ